MDEKDSCAAPVVDSGSGLCLLILLVCSSRCVPSFGCQAKSAAPWPDSYGRTRRRHWQWHVQCWFCGLWCSRCVSFCCCQAQMLGIMTSKNQKDTYAAGWFHWSSRGVFSVLVVRPKMLGI